MAQSVRGSSRERWRATRSLREFIMRLHTGETLTDATPSWEWEERTKLGQEYLRNLAEDFLSGASHDEKHVLALLRQLELDGYIFREGRLQVPEAQVLDVEEEVTVLESLFRELGLANNDTAFHHLSLSEDHFRDGRWEDSISNSRKFLECILQEIAAEHSKINLGSKISNSIYGSPASVRNYLEREGLIESKERETLAAVYGLLSQTGGHPYMAQEDQARLLRHMALTLSQFAMLRLDGSIDRTSG